MPIPALKTHHPQHVALSFEKTGQLQPASGKTLTINGPVDAGLWQIFGGSGTVTGTPQIECVYPQWFGAAGDGVTDDTTPMQKAFDSFKLVRLPNGEYKITDTLTATGITIEGLEVDGSWLVFYNESGDGLVSIGAGLRRVNMMCVGGFSGSLLHEQGTHPTMTSDL
jgi:hypothetical protein